MMPRLEIKAGADIFRTGPCGTWAQPAGNSLSLGLSIEWHKNMKDISYIAAVQGWCLLLLLWIRSAHLGSGLRYSNFFRNLPTNTRVFFRNLRLCGKCRSYQGLSEATKKIGGNRAFFRDN